MSAKLHIQWTTLSGDVLGAATVDVATELSATPRISHEDAAELLLIQRDAANKLAAQERMAERISGPIEAV